MNFVNLYKDVAVCENVGYSNCNKAEDQLEVWTKAHPDLQADADATAMNIAKVKASIPIMGDRIRSSIRQFAVLCRDTDLEAFLKEQENGQVEYVQD